MAKYRLILKPLSPFQTPLHSDTLFGHICWALRYLKGEEELLKFLKAFNDTDAPFILSSGFPDGYLPMPVLRPLSIDEEETLQKTYKTELDFVREMKALKKVSYIPISVMAMLKNDLSYYNLYTKYRNKEIILTAPEISKTDEVWHNTKNRLTNRVVIEGGLFAKEDTFFEKDAKFIVYIEDTYFGKKNLEETFGFISRSGYGADKSVGRGMFNYDLQDEWGLPETENPNAFITLSHYHPKEGDFKDGFYDTVTKFGKIGGHWASGINGGPHKMPLLMLTPGSVFFTDSQKSFYGSLIPNIHKQQGVVHYGIALPLKVRVV